jgi:hypothetical protein
LCGLGEKQIAALTLGIDRLPGRATMAARLLGNLMESLSGSSGTPRRSGRRAE